MSRLINAFEQILDGSGDPVALGLVDFFESGSSSARKTTFADSAQTIANSNPVVLGGDGRCPNVFGTGSYNAILRTSAGVQILVRDVGQGGGLTFGDDWSATREYSATDQVRDAALYWQSIVSGNLGNQPSLDSGAKWVKTDFTKIVVNTAGIATNTTGIATNTASIATNATAINARVSKTGNETIAGVKTFSSNPLSGASQSTAVNAFTRKDYVDSVSRKVVKIVNSQTGVYATGTTQIPFDNTIPQKTEGNEFLTLAITPSSASNDLYIEVSFFIAATTASSSTVALFIDTESNAIACASSFLELGGEHGIIAFNHKRSAGSTNEIIFKIRGGGNAGTFSINGTNTAKLGGVISSSITITEVKS